MLFPLVALASLTISDAPACEKARGERIAALGLAQATPHARYRGLLAHCGPGDVLTLAQAMIRFPTVNAPGAVVASAPAFADLRRFLEGWARQRDLAFETFGGNEVFVVGSGEAKAPPVLAFLGHGDVVPAPAHEWTRPPFEPRIEAGRLYGRGSEDDKAPLAAALVAMALAKEAGLTTTGRVLTLIGTGEESDWTGMKKYASTQPHATSIVSIDASFPLVIAEAGFVSWQLRAPLGNLAADLDAEIVALNGGEFLTQVPGAATLELRARKGTAEALRARVERAIAAAREQRPGLVASARVDAGVVKLSVQGHAVHSSIADQGRNALWELPSTVRGLRLGPEGPARVLDALEKFFDGDHWGERLGIAYRDALMGRLLVAPTMLRLQTGAVTLDVNMRRPQGLDARAFRASLDAALARIQEASDGAIGPGTEPHVGDAAVSDARGPLAVTLLDIYRAHTGKKDAQPVSSRGSTYARLFPGAVTFGPSFPNEAYTGHGPDEFIELKALASVTQMLGEVVLRLATEAERPQAKPSF